MIKKFRHIMALSGADYVLAVQQLSEDDRKNFYDAMTAKDRDHNNRAMLTPRHGPEFPLQIEKDDEIVVMNWQPNDLGIGGQLFYRKDTGKYGTRATAKGHKAEIIFDEDYPVPGKNERGNFSYAMLPMLKAEELAPQLSAQVAKLAGVLLPEFKPDKWEDDDGKDNDWSAIEKTSDDEGLELEISYSDLRRQFRVAVTRPHDETLCKKFAAAYVPRFGMDVSDQNQAYAYAENLAQLLDRKHDVPSP